MSVANRFLADVELEDESLKGKLALHMALEHLSVGDASAKYAQTQRRYNYVTPKSYLELIGFYKYVFGEKRMDIQRQIDRLDVGLSTLKKTSRPTSRNSRSTWRGPWSWSRRRRRPRTN